MMDSDFNSKMFNGLSQRLSCYVLLCLFANVCLNVEKLLLKNKRATMEYNSEGLALLNEFQNVAELGVIEMYD